MNKNVVIEDCPSDHAIANGLAGHSASDYKQRVSKGPTFDVAYDASCTADHGQVTIGLPHSTDCIAQSITVELINQRAAKLTEGKAWGPHDLSTEQVVYTHPLTATYRL